MSLHWDYQCHCVNIITEAELLLLPIVCIFLFLSLKSFVFGYCQQLQKIKSKNDTMPALINKMQKKSKMCQSFFDFRSKSSTLYIIIQNKSVNNVIYDCKLNYHKKIMCSHRPYMRVLYNVNS